MLRFLIFFSFIILTKSKSILPSNTTVTTTIQKTSLVSTQSTSITTTTTLHTIITTTIKSEEKTTVPPASTTTLKNDQPYEFHSNFSRNNDSVFVSLRLNASETFISINNTFTNMKNNISSSEIIFNEYTNFNTTTQTRIIINFNEPFTRDLAIHLGDRFIDFADLLLTVRSMNNRTNIGKTV